MNSPLGYDGKILNKKKSLTYWRKFISWRKGFKAGKKGKSKVDNPYKLSEEIWTLLRKRARWQMGYEEGWEAGRRKRLAREKRKQKKRKK